MLAESFERIPAATVEWGAAPGLCAGQSRESLGLTGSEVYNLTGIAAGLVPGGRVTVKAVGDGGKETSFEAVVRLNSPVELEYLKHGGILPRVLRKFLEK